MGSMDSSLEQTGLISALGSTQYNPNLQHPTAPFHSHLPAYPHLTIQTGQLPQPQSPPGSYGPHYQPSQRHGYPPSRDYRYSYGQSYTSPTTAVPPHAIYSPVLQHPHSMVHDYFRHPPTPLYYPDYLTSPTSAAPPISSGLHYGGQHQSVSWNAPAVPSTVRIQPHAGMNNFRWQDNPVSPDLSAGGHH